MTRGAERSIRQGDLYWVHPGSAPERGSLPAAPHPQLVIQDDLFNRSRVETVIVCALTSNLERMHEPGNVLLEVGEGNLPRQSVLMVSQVSSLPKRELGEYIGRLSPERVEQVLSGLRFQQAAFFR